MSNMPQTITPSAPDSDEYVYLVEGMTCASCVARVEKAIRAVDGVIDVNVNLATERAYIFSTDVRDGAIEAAVSKAGYVAQRPRTTTEQQQKEHGLDAAERRARTERLHVLLAAFLSAPLLIGMVITMYDPAFHVPAWLQFLLATPVQFWLGGRFYRGAFSAIKARAGNMDLLVSLGTTAAYGMSLYLMATAQPHAAPHLYFEASAVIVTFVLLGKWLEGRAKGQTASAIRALMNLRPDVARVRRGGLDIEVPVSSLTLDDIVVVKPGDRLPVDGVVTEGAGAVDESMLTGESIPLDKKTGDSVTGGSINLDGALTVRVTAIGTETVLAKIIRMVEGAQASKAAIQRLVDKFSAIFVPAVLGIAAITFAAWYLVDGSFENATLAAVAVLVIACPCALGLATPTAIMVGTGVAAKQGILIRDAQTLEQAKAIQIVAFDKTGTLTEGKPRVEGVYATNEGAQEVILRTAAQLQASSSHPLAKAVLDYVHHFLGTKAGSTAKSATPGPTVSEFRNHAGMGVSGKIGGDHFIFGNIRLMHLYKIDTLSLETVATEAEADGHSVSWLAQTGTQARLIGIMSFGDAVKRETPAAIRQLHQLGIKTVMITGDNVGAAYHIAKKLGITTIRANVLPDQKAQTIEELQSGKVAVAMVGDGVNDAPALAQADIGIAMGSGTDVAMQTAGITLMRGDLSLIAGALDISRRTYGKIRQGLFWAFIYNLVGIPLAAMGLLSPMLAGAAMALSSVSVVLNALTLRGWTPPEAGKGQM